MAAITSDDAALVAAVYLSMDWAAWAVLVPLSLATLVTGVIQSLNSSWGLWRHYSVIVKLVLTVVATVVLALYTETLSTFAEVAGRDVLGAAEPSFLRSPSVVLHSTGALALLVTATVLAIYKPAGLTRRGQRLRLESQRARQSASTPPK